MYGNNQSVNLAALLRGRPIAAAAINGSRNFPEIHGMVKFFNTRWGALVVAEVAGLPNTSEKCSEPIFGFHIHGGGQCTGNMNDPFADAGTHYDPHGCPHPYHAGDMPPLFGAMGHAFSAFLTDRFTIDEIIGKVVIIHDSPDDFTTQPAGNSGKKIACGVIHAMAQPFSPMR